MHISIIIPTLNEERALPGTLANIARCAPGCEVIIADGGSADRTRTVAESFGALPVVWVESSKGRGTQMNAGAARATGDVLLFLHADTHLPPGTPALIEQVLRHPRTLGGFFRIAFAPCAPLADFYAGCYNIRSYFRLFYGDAALFLRREVFEQMGGYPPVPLMEDVEFILRLRGRGKLAYIRAGTVVSSSRRFPSTAAGFKMLGVWFWLHVLMASGVAPEKLVRFYPDMR